MKLSQILNDIFTGPCTLFLNGSPDGKYDWSGCCDAHDYAFDHATVTRYQADEYLWYCVYAKTGSKFWSGLIFYGVRFFAYPAWLKHRLNDYISDNLIGEL